MVDVDNNPLPTKQYACLRCSYSTEYKQNLTRHIKALHEDSSGGEQEEEGKASQEAPPEMDVEEYINERLATLLKENGVKDVKIPRVEMNSMKSFFSGGTATFCAGLCVGYLVTSNLGPLMNMMMLKKKASSPGFLIPPTSIPQHLQQQAATATPAPQQQQKPKVPEVPLADVSGPSSV